MKRIFKAEISTFKLLVTCLALVSVGSFAGVINYKVKPGDTLSSILFDHNLGPLYGKNGLVKSTYKLNKIKKAGDLIHIGAIIKLPVEDEVAISTPTPPILPQTVPQLAQESRAPSDEFPYSHFVYSPHISFLKADSTNDIKFGGSTVSTYSKSGFGIDLAWHVFYDDRFSYSGFASLNYFSFYNDPSYTLNKLNSTPLHFGVGGCFEYSPELKFSSSIFLREIIFLDALTPLAINLESIAVPEIKLGIEKTLFTKKRLSGTVNAHINGILPASRGSYTSKMGYGAGAGFEMIHKNKSLFLNYNLRSLQISDIKNKENLIVIGMNFYGDND
jgi:hypothetical protein